MCAIGPTLDGGGRLGVFENQPYKGVSRIRRLKMLSLWYLGPFENVERIGEAAYRLNLSTELSLLHDVFHISVLRKAVKEPYDILVADRVPIDSGLVIMVTPIRIKDTEVKRL